MEHGSWRRVCLAGLLWIASATTSACRLPIGSRDHLMVLDQDGAALDPTRSDSPFPFSRTYPTLAGPQVDAYVKNLIDSIRCRVKGDDSPRVLLFINGGLNGIESSVKRSNRLTRTILEDVAYEGKPDDRAYPVFIAWDSDLFGSWLQDTFVVRRGQKNGVLGFFSFPFEIIEDLGRGLLHVPQNVLYYNPDTYLRGHYNYNPPTISASRAVAVSLARESRGKAPGEALVQFETDPDAARKPFFLMRFWHWFVLQPIQAVPNIFVDGMGTSAWDEMERRTQLLFESEKSSNAGTTRPPELTPLLSFLKALRGLQEELPELDVDLFCHSMGCIVGNRILELGVDDRKASVPRFRHIVYMGAACSVGDYERSVFPYLQEELERAREAEAVIGARRIQDSSPHFYHVTLHERMENHESNFYSLSPYGSLLAWVDNYYARTRTPSDRVLGNFTNLLRGYAKTPCDLRKNIHIRSYGLDSRGRTQPVEHGDFDDCKFWRQSFYVPDGTKGWDPDQP